MAWFGNDKKRDKNESNGAEGSAEAAKGPEVTISKLQLIA